MKTEHSGKTPFQRNPGEPSEDTIERIMGQILPDDGQLDEKQVRQMIAEILQEKEQVVSLEDSVLTAFHTYKEMRKALSQQLENNPEEFSDLTRESLKEITFAGMNALSAADLENIARKKLLKQREIQEQDKPAPGPTPSRIKPKPR